jgi:hypothetical protein
MTYTVKEILYTLQGEGANTGRAAVFCRLPAVISGRDVNRIGRRQFAGFATRILSASTALAAGALGR